MRIWVLLLVPACATTHIIPDTGDVHTPALRLPADAATEVIEPSFPAHAGEARLPSADLLRVALRGEGIERATARLRVCIAPGGNVIEATLAEPTGHAQLDAAIARDVAGWTYEPYAAPASVRVCTPVSLIYRP
ncbi:MAG: hypothetical protein JO257_16345 [Deltaproteobacteria bacterium]|nr:hypothetical protein [Deltaproteobacteria bacterium]